MGIGQDGRIIRRPKTTPSNDSNEEEDGCGSSILGIIILVLAIIGIIAIIGVI